MLVWCQAVVAGCARPRPSFPANPSNEPRGRKLSMGEGNRAQSNGSVSRALFGGLRRSLKDNARGAFVATPSSTSYQIGPETPRGLFRGTL